ncbi:MAG: formate C-acetyltransferase [Peptococcaceae bacterium]|nr:formate C-acetyltransferase [Peptococcaceae bacterium]
MFQEWQGFLEGNWTQSIDVRDFILRNYVPYDGDGSFLKGPSTRTAKLWNRCLELMKKESKRGGVLDIDTTRVAKITSHKPGYIDRESELIFGIQTDAPLKRGINLYGGLKISKEACKAYGKNLHPNIEKFFLDHRKTHNDGVFSVYPEEIKKLRKYKLLTGLPDGYGRGRIIGDYRRVALYGVDYLIEQKRKDLRSFPLEMSEDEIRLREEIDEQIKALRDLKIMAESYGFDLSRPAGNAKEAIQWLYFAYLAVVKEQNGAAMSIGRNTAFLDIYIQRDLQNRLIGEEEAQELIDQFIIKLRMVRELRTPEYNQLFAGDPLWITEVLGGTGLDARHMVTRTSFRYLQTLNNLGTSPEPNITILWSENLPENFKKFCTELSIRTSAIQYENDDLLRGFYGDDYGIACCVSPMRLGKEMQFFGARCNIAKLLLVALNGGKDEISGTQILPQIDIYPDKVLVFEEVMDRFIFYLDILSKHYVNALNIIHYMHDKYDYERMEMSLHDTHVKRTMAFGIAGLSVLADSLSAIKFTEVTPVFRDGLIVDFKISGTFPAYGNDLDEADDLAQEITRLTLNSLRKYKTYRDATHTLSVLTITSNVVYGKHTGNTPDGRRAGTPFSPGANPVNGRDKSGLIASMNSVCKIPYETCRDGISYTVTLTPALLGKIEHDRPAILSGLLDGYFLSGGYHVNVNILQKEDLMEAMENPARFPNLTIRVSGYAVRFNSLTKEQQLDVISRTFHEKL